MQVEKWKDIFYITVVSDSPIYILYWTDKLFELRPWHIPLILTQLYFRIQDMQTRMLPSQITPQTTQGSIPPNQRCRANLVNGLGQIHIAFLFTSNHQRGLIQLCFFRPTTAGSFRPRQFVPHVGKSSPG